MYIFLYKPAYIDDAGLWTGFLYRLTECRFAIAVGVNAYNVLPGNEEHFHFRYCAKWLPVIPPFALCLQITFLSANAYIRIWRRTLWGNANYSYAPQHQYDRRRPAVRPSHAGTMSKQWRYRNMRFPLSRSQGNLVFRDQISHKKPQGDHPKRRR